MEITITQEIILFKIIFVPLSCFCLLISSFIFQAYVGIILDISLFLTENYPFRRLQIWFLFSLQWNSSSLSLYSLPSTDVLILKHHSALQFSLFSNMCSRGTLIFSFHYSKLFLIFFIMYRFKTGKCAINFGQNSPCNRLAAT